ARAKLSSCLCSLLVNRNVFKPSHCYGRIRQNEPEEYRAESGYQNRCEKMFPHVMHSSTQERASPATFWERGPRPRLGPRPPLRILLRTSRGQDPRGPREPLLQ